MNVGVDTFLLQETAEDIGVGGGNFLTIEPFQTWVVDTLGDGQTQPALTEAQSRDDLRILVAFHELVFAHHTNVGHTACHTLRDVIITQVQHFEGEVRRLDQQCAP